MRKLSKCPFCSDYDHFDAALKSRITAERIVSVEIRQDVRHLPPRWRKESRYLSAVAETQERGKYWYVALSLPFREEVAKENRGRSPSFMVEILGLKYRKKPPTPPPPFFHVDQFIQPNRPIHYVSYQACLISCTTSPLEVMIHWWPDHGRKVTINDFPLDKATSTDFERLKEALNLFRYSETRGKKESITERAVKAAIRNLEQQDAPLTRKTLALNLNCNYDTLQKWLKRHPQFSSIFAPGAERPKQKYSGQITPKINHTTSHPRRLRRASV